MTTKICPYCGVEKQARGFHVHLKMCGEKNKPEIVEPPNPLRQRYAQQLSHMTPEQGDKFLRKAQGL